MYTAYRPKGNCIRKHCGSHGILPGMACKPVGIVKNRKSGLSGQKACRLKFVGVRAGTL